MSALQFPDEVSRALQVHPKTGEKLELLEIIQEPGRGSRVTPTEDLPSWVSEKNGREGVNPAHWSHFERYGWSLFFDTTDRGLVIRSVRYQDTFFIFKMLVPWLAHGDPCHLTQYFLKTRLAGPIVFIFPTGFVIWAKYKFGRYSTLEQAFHFFEDGTFYPLVYHRGPSTLRYIPIYIDFDIITASKNFALTYYPWAVLPGKAEREWHLAVTEFERVSSRVVPEDGNYNIILENWHPPYLANARVEFNERDHATQFVSKYIDYHLDKHPLLNLRGHEIVQQDLVYVYVIQRAPTGLYGPRVSVEAFVPDQHHKTGQSS